MCPLQYSAEHWRGILPSVLCEFQQLPSPWLLSFISAAQGVHTIAPEFPLPASPAGSCFTGGWAVRELSSVLSLRDHYSLLPDGRCLGEKGCFVCFVSLKLFLIVLGDRVNLFPFTLSWLRFSVRVIEWSVAKQGISNWNIHDVSP